MPFIRNRRLECQAIANAAGRAVAVCENMSGPSWEVIQIAIRSAAGAGSGGGSGGSGSCTNVLAEPFENVTTNGWVKTGGWTGSIIPGRNGNCLRQAILDGVTYTIPAANESDTITLGFAIRFSSLASTGDFVEIKSDAGATIHAYLHFLSGSGGRFRLLDGTLGVVWAQTALGFPVINTWYYMEVQMKLHDVTGTAIFRINGTQIGSTFTGDTKNGGTKTTIDRLQMINMVTGNVDFDDLYLSTGSGCAFKGDTVVPVSGVLPTPVASGAIPSCSTYLGRDETGLFISTTAMGNADTDSFPNITVKYGESLCAIWSGAPQGTVCTMNVVYNEI